MEDIVHPVTEFNNLPWHELDPDQCTMSWSFRIVEDGEYWQSRGLKAGQLIIDIIDDKDLHSEIWVCPDPLAAVVKMAQYLADDAVRNEIRDWKLKFFSLIERRKPPCKTGVAAKMI